MSKASVVQRNIRRRKMIAQLSEKRADLKKRVFDTTLDLAARFQAKIHLDSMSRDSSKVRLRNRCEMTGRGRGVYRKFGLSRITLRELASRGMLPGVRKASW